MTFKPFFLLTAILYLADASGAAKSGLEVNTSGFVYYQIGQIQQVTPPDDALPNRTFDQHFNARLTVDAVIRERLRIILGGEAEYGAVLTKDMSQKRVIFLKEAQGIYSFGNPDNSYLQIAAGYFPFKYNPEATNLGEYLFRTGAYPGYIITDFDFAKMRLMGFRVSSFLFDKTLQLHALFTSEYMEPPYFDYSLSFLAGYNLISIVDFGAGINFNRILPIQPEKTTDHSNIVMDDQLNVVFEHNDTLFYTKKGIKLMGRMTFNPQPLLPFAAELLGPNDGKLYSEVALLGFKNYGTFYSDRSKRIPFMAGFNFPTFPALTYGVLPIGMIWGWRKQLDAGTIITTGISLIVGGGFQVLESALGNVVGKKLRFDVLSGEIEYYGCDPDWKSDMPTAANKVLPDPYDFGQPRSFWKWSFFGQKTITEGLAVKGLIGRDHYRSYNNVGNYDAVERMNGPGDWHYKLRLMYSF